MGVCLLKSIEKHFNYQPVFQPLTSHYYIINTKRGFFTFHLQQNL